MNVLIIITKDQKNKNKQLKYCEKGLKKGSGCRIPIDCGSKSDLCMPRNMGLGLARESRGDKGPSIVHNVRHLDKA